MAKSRYSSSKKGNSRRSRRSRHTKSHSRRHPHHTRRRGRGRGRGHRGGGSGSCPSRGFELSTGGYASNEGTAWNFQNPTGGRS